MSVVVSATQVQPNVSFFNNVFRSQTSLKIQSAAYDALKHLVSSLAGLTGGVLGIFGGAVLVVVGSAIGIGSLALHLINLYGMCVKDGAEACYLTCYNYMSSQSQAVEA